MITRTYLSAWAALVVSSIWLAAAPLNDMAHVWAGLWLAFGLSNFWMDYRNERH